MLDLELDLIALGADIEWPPTPQLRVVVSPVVVALPAGPRRQIPRRVLAAAAILLIVAGLLAYTPSRDVIAGWLNLHTTINRVKNLPSPSPRPPGQLGENLNLGTPTTLAGAESQVSWKIVVPASLGAPDVVYIKLSSGGGPSQGEVTLVYAERPGIKVSGQTGVTVLVTEARGSVSDIFFHKILGPESTLEPVTVKGHSGYWISGHPHDFVFTDAGGNFYTEQMRLATNTLIFDDNGTIVRIEGDLTRAQALEIASSIA